ncbi:MAG TPA: pyridoxamine 5'-phosphate oxidase family protein [Acidimicrobiia bacterium]|nr:pyridoxamine 5'-phosphate oxidase family protein [Acidimicrobiia bacterium]
MPGYGVPEDPDGLLPWTWAEERLAGCRNYWVVTADASGRPHAMPVWGVWSTEDSVFWFSASHGSRKIRNLSENPQMVVTTDDSREVVSVEGRAHPLEAGTRARMAWAWAMKYADDPEAYESDPGAQKEMADFVLANAIYEMVPERAFGMIETPEDFSRRATKWVW